MTAKAKSCLSVESEKWAVPEASLIAWDVDLPLIRSPSAHPGRARRSSSLRSTMSVSVLGASRRWRRPAWRKALAHPPESVPRRRTPGDADLGARAGRSHGDDADGCECDRRQDSCRGDLQPGHQQAPDKGMAQCRHGRRWAAPVAAATTDRTHAVGTAAIVDAGDSSMAPTAVAVTPRQMSRSRSRFRPLASR